MRVQGFLSFFLVKGGLKIDQAQKQVPGIYTHITNVYRNIMGYYRPYDLYEVKDIGGRCLSVKNEDSLSFIVSREDWSLHRKGYQDQVRHQQKIKDVIRQNLPDLITEENIILSDGKQIIKVPIRSLDEYRFIYNYQKQKHVGQGDGDSKVGDVLGRDSSQQPGKGEKAGDQPGYDVIETEVSIEELENMLFEELELPLLQPKDKEAIETHSIVFNDIRKKGIVSNIDKKRTILENLRRNAMAGNPGIHRISPDDLRFKTWDDTVIPESNAVIIAMMDTSGSMGVS